MNLIREKKSEIMELWKKRVLEIIPAAENQSQLALYNSLPDYIENLSKLLDPKDGDEMNVAQGKEDLIGKVHGQHRANSSYTISQMIEEYFILKDVILDILRSDGTISLELCEKINISFQKTLQTSVSQFTKSLLDSQENFVTSLAHDLRTPLMIIKMQSEMMLKKQAFLPGNAEKIIKSVNKVDSMIEHLLNTIRSQHHGFNDSDASDFDLKVLVAKVIADYEDIYPEVLQITGESTFVHWNAHSFERVIDNLVSNAVKYGDTSRPVTINLKSDEGNVYFSVHNFGTPIPPEEQVTLFQKFKRSEDAKNQKGWGIGLSYVKSVVESHKGIVLVNSDEQGTTFKFEIPRDIAESHESSHSSHH